MYVCGGRRAAPFRGRRRQCPWRGAAASTASASVRHDVRMRRRTSRRAASPRPGNARCSCRARRRISARLPCGSHARVGCDDQQGPDALRAASASHSDVAEPYSWPQRTCSWACWAAGVDPHRSRQWSKRGSKMTTLGTTPMGVPEAGGEVRVGAEGSRSKSPPACQPGVTTV